MITSIETRLRREKDRRGWKHPWHEHWRIIRNGVDLPHEPKLAPIYAINCRAADCEAPGCPRTASGFPEGVA